MNVVNLNSRARLYFFLFFRAQHSPVHPPTHFLLAEFMANILFAHFALHANIHIVESDIL